MNYLDAGIEVIKKIEENGFKAYFVGGVVRDFLLGVNYNDIDIATSASPSDIELIFDVSKKRIKYSSVIIEYNGYEFETTTFREEINYADFRHPTFRIASSIKEDLKRRDFTINAMAMDKNLEVIDLFNGKKDLDKKVIRTVLTPDVRFKEDALRMLRALYFSAKLNFSIEKATFTSIKKNAYLIQMLSKDRILLEIEKLTNSNYPLVGLAYLADSNILQYVTELKEGTNLILKKKFNNLDYFTYIMICFYKHQASLDSYPFTIKEKKDLRTIFEALKMDLTSPITIFKYGARVCLYANTLNILFNNKKDLTDIIKSVDDNLSLKNVRDLEFRARNIKDLLPNIALSDIGKIENEVIELVLLNKLANNKKEIEDYLLKKYE